MGNKVHVDRWRLNVPPEVESVYDAAMAYLRAIEAKNVLYGPAPDDGPLSGVTVEQQDVAWDQVDVTYDLFIEACRKAEEVERG